MPLEDLTTRSLLISYYQQELARMAQSLYWLGWTLLVSNLGRDKRWFLFSSKPSIPAVELTQLVFNGYRVSFPRLKRPGRDVDHSPPSSVVVKNEWSHTPAIYLYDVGRQIYLLKSAITRRAVAVPTTCYGCDMVDDSKYWLNMQLALRWYLYEV